MAGLILYTTAGIAVSAAMLAERWRRQNRSLTQQLLLVQTEQADLSAELTAAQTRMEASADYLKGVFTLDRLELIDGLTPHHARLLNAAGIFTYDALAQLSPDDIVALTAAAGGARLDVTRWIDQAKLFAVQVGATV